MTKTNAKVNRFCVECGTKFEADNNMVRYCPECAKKHKELLKEKQKQYAKSRMKELNLTNISIYKETKDILKKIAEEKGVTMAEVLKELVTEPVKKAPKKSTKEPTEESK